MKTFRRLTKAQNRAFEDVATMNVSVHLDKTLKALERYGLIQQIGEKVICRDRFGIVTTAVYEVPLPIHIEWCKWCSEHYKEDDENS